MLLRLSLSQSPQTEDQDQDLDQDQESGITIAKIRSLSGAMAHVTRGIMGITQPWLGDCTLLSKSIRFSSVSNHNAYDL